MNWKYNNIDLEEVPDEKAIGFVYLITNLIDGRKYIGKKNFWATQTRQKTVTVKSTGLKKKKKLKSKVESNWRDYYGSSEELKLDIEAKGSENFSREILRLCYSKGELSYYEAKFQLERDVLLNPSMWYNSWVSLKVHRIHLKHLFP